PGDGLPEDPRAGAEEAGHRPRRAFAYRRGLGPRRRPYRHGGLEAQHEQQDPRAPTWRTRRKLQRPERRHSTGPRQAIPEGNRLPARTDRLPDWLFRAGPPRPRVQALDRHDPDGIPG